ncbi:hypothetical protein OY671_009205, partial [Metschnikowia pulcherrima]
HVSADGNFSWEEVECLGACVNAPMVMIWKDTYEDSTPESSNRVLDGFETGNLPKPGPQIARQFAAPASGPTSLTTPASNDNKGSASAPSKPASTDAESKKQTEAANVQERPSPKPPMGDATATNPPKGDNVQGLKVATMLDDKDRIFRNLYGLDDWGLEGARRRGA